MKTKLLIASIVIALLAWGQIEKNEADFDQYCDRVSDYKSSGGEFGWPDFNENYATKCEGK